MTAPGLLDNRLARVSDADRPEFLEAFRELEQFSNRYVREMSDKGLFPAVYPWPLDPLHNWTRWWEYTFAWLHVRRLLGAQKTVQILDVGSALTFFPVFLAQRGAQVHALDADARMSGWATAALQRLECVDPEVRQRLQSVTADCRSTKFPDASIDVVTNISVLEHLDNQDVAIQELPPRAQAAGHLREHAGSLGGWAPVWRQHAVAGGRDPGLHRAPAVDVPDEEEIAFTHPLDVLAFSNRPRALTRAVADTPSAQSGLVARVALTLWHRWLRQVVKVVQSRILVRPVATIPIRAVTFAFNSKRLDMWTVLGVVVQKQA